MIAVLVAGLALAPCNLTARVGPQFSQATGQHTISFVLTNRGTTTCVLEGYPRVAARHLEA